MANLRQKCDLCDCEAVYDAKTTMGPWGFLCQAHFDTYGVKTEGLYNKLNKEVLPTKVCVICGKKKDISEFYKYKDLNKVERYRNDCKTCNLEQKKKMSFKK